ncbi:MAG TPA: glutaredoxin domain-containing protein [Anaerolineae bacterium]|nr:glutaredoxin domain-containing protein [Anaerolineae bacterium]
MNEQKIIVYGTPICPLVAPVRSLLDTAQIPYTYIDITEDEDGRQHVLQINNGNETVPTLIFPDNSSLTEPNPSQLRHKLADFGYELNTPAMWARYILTNPFNWILFFGVLLAILRILGVF